MNLYPLRLLGVLAAAVLLLVAGCDRAPDASVATTQPVPADTGAMRLISLTPALTQMLVDLGQAHLLVGVGQNDAAAPSDAKLPIVGTYLDPDIEGILALRPTHILITSGKEGPSRRLAAVALEHGITIANYRYPNSIEDVGRILMDEDEFISGGNGETVSLGTLLDIKPQAHSLKLGMLVRLGALNNATYTPRPPNVLLLIGDGLMASGPGTVLNQLLTQINARNAAWDAAVPAPTFDREKLLAARPDVILFLLPDAPPLGPLDQDERLASLRGLDIPAVKQQRIVLVNDPLVLLPSSSLDRIAATLARAVYPDQAAAIDTAMQATLGTPAPSQPASNPTPATDVAR